MEVSEQVDTNKNLNMKNNPYTTLDPILPLVLTQQRRKWPEKTLRLVQTTPSAFCTLVHSHCTNVHNLLVPETQWIVPVHWVSRPSYPYWRTFFCSDFELSTWPHCPIRSTSSVSLVIFGFLYLRKCLTVSYKWKK